MCRSALQDRKNGPASFFAFWAIPARLHYSVRTGSRRFVGAAIMLGSLPLGQMYKSFLVSKVMSANSKILPLNWALCASFFGLNIAINPPNQEEK